MHTNGIYIYRISLNPILTHPSCEWNLGWALCMAIRALETKGGSTRLQWENMVCKGVMLVKQ